MHKKCASKHTHTHIYCLQACFFKRRLRQPLSGFPLTMAHACRASGKSPTGEFLSFSMVGLGGFSASSTPTTTFQIMLPSAAGSRCVLEWETTHPRRCFAVDMSLQTNLKTGSLKHTRPSHPKPPETPARAVFACATSRRTWLSSDPSCGGAPRQETGRRVSPGLLTGVSQNGEPPLLAFRGKPKEKQPGCGGVGGVGDVSETPG